MVSVDRWTLEDPLEAFDEYLVRVRGVCPGTRRNYVNYVHAFFETVIADAPKRTAEVGPREVVEFVRGLTRRYRPGTVALAVSALRSFFGFLQVEGLCDGWLVDAIPMVPRRRTGLVRHLAPERLE